jgi:putative hemolysin
MSSTRQPVVIAVSHAVVSLRQFQSIMEIAVISAATNEQAFDVAPHLYVELASGASDIAAAQRLRYRVFVEEMGARATVHSPGREHDYFDPWCEHLIVRDRASGTVIGTSRVLKADNARRLGAFCAEREFDLTRLGHLRRKLVELGRTCVDPAYRTHATAMLLLSGVAKFARERGASHLIACASISMTDRGVNAAAVYGQLARRHLAPSEYRITARSPLAALANPPWPNPAIPSLIMAYLRLGAWIGGEPAWDPDFNIADLLVILPVARSEARSARSFQNELQAA